MDTIIEPTKYQVSTMTCNASLNININLSVFFNNLNISNNTFVWCDFPLMKQIKGTYPTFKKKKKKVILEDGKEPTKFENQVTILYLLGNNYCPNIKVFKNGNLHMTGIKKIEDGMRVINIVADEIKRIHEIDNSIADISNIRPGDFIIRMINSDFAFPYKIKRKSLHQLLISEKYNNKCSFEPLTYPGVKLQFFWKNGSQRDGVCVCDKECFGKGVANQCKKVTVAIFDSGSTLITGANSFEQLEVAYQYICRVVKENESLLKKTITINEN